MPGYPLHVHRNLHRIHVELALGAQGELPSEVRLFVAGENKTRKGTFLFDDRGAQLTLASNAEHGVDTMIDLEHLSTDAEAKNYDPDARGWCRLAVRHGDLWATAISWTDDGATRLRNRTQRYVSPAFLTDEDGRVVEIFNIALTALPATDHAMPLVANRTSPSRTASDKENTMDPKKLRELVAMVKAGRSPEECMTALALDLKTIQNVVKAMGGDPGGDLASLFGAIQSFAAELAAIATGKAVEEPAAEPSEGDAMPAAASALRAGAEQIVSLREESAKMARELETLRAEKRSREDTERAGLVGQLVQLGRETPATAWQDGKPRGSLGTMPIEELRARVSEFTKLGSSAPAKHEPASAKVTQMSGIEISEYEQSRLKVACARNKADFDQALIRYAEHKGQQLAGATKREDQQRFSRPLEQKHCLANSAGRFGQYEFVQLAAVKPIEQFSGASQRALEEFRVEYLSSLASMPVTWAETYGQLLSSGALRETFPIEYDASIYREKTASNAAATTPTSYEITVDKRDFRAAKEALLIKIRQGDFAYVQSWQNKASQLADARVHLRNELVTALLQAATTGYWGQTVTLATGIDGQAFFSANHKVNPARPEITWKGATVWSNYQAAATPLDATHLTEEKQHMLEVPAPNGQDMGGRATGILHPTCLDTTAENLLTVQNLISDGTTTIANPHFQSGFRHYMCPELAGTTVTADYYLISDERRQRGMMPWVVSEGATEEILEWDESSDFYKGSGMVKVESVVLVNAALLYPHAIRLVKGA